MRQAAAGAAIVALLAITAWSTLTAVTAVSEGKGHGSVFKTSVALIGIVAVVALWLAARLYRTRFANRNVKAS